MAVTTTQTQVARKYQVTLGTGVGSEDIMDIGACLSKVNHRLYRQGRMYRTKLTLDTRTTDALTGDVKVYALMPTWYVHAAWRMAKKAYDDALADEKAILSEGNLARWRDFRVAAGYSNNFPAGNLNPESWSTPTLGTSPNMKVEQFTGGEFNYSTVEDLDTGAITGFSWPSPILAALPGDWFDMMKELENSRNESTSPTTVIGDMPYHQLMSDANDIDYVELQANGNEPPYERVTLPQHIWVQVGVLHARNGAGNGWVTSTGYFDAPCGLVILDSSDDLGEGVLSVEVAGGDYRGVHAPAM